MPLIKHYHLPPLPSESEAEAEKSPLRRIPVSLIRASEAEALQEDYKRRHVVRREEARVLARAFELPILEFEPAFPLPAPPEPPAAPEPPPDLETLKATWDAAWQARLEEATETARKEGFEKGYAEAEAALREEVEKDRAALAETASHLQDTWRQFMVKTEPLLSHLAFTMAQAILDAPLSNDVKELSTRALSQAVDKLSQDPPLQISVHPVDLLRLRETGIVDQLEASFECLQWDSNDTLKEGDWIVQSPVAMVRHLKEELLHTLRERLSLPPLEA